MNHDRSNQDMSESGENGRVPSPSSADGRPNQNIREPGENEHDPLPSNTDDRPNQDMSAPEESGRVSSPSSADDGEGKEHDNKKGEDDGVAVAGLKEWGWWWEVGGVVFSFCCIGAMIGVLAYCDGRSLSEWSMSIKPNSLISVFSTVAKSALLMPLGECISQLKWLHYDKARSLSHLQAYDNASRGPWGSLMFVLTTRASSMLATAAAFLTIAALALEPTSQMVIEYTTRNVTLSNTTAYIASPTAWASKGFNASAQNKEVVSLQSLILTAFTDKSSELAPDFDCPTSDCQWPTFESIGVCHSCNTTVVSAAEDENLKCRFYVTDVTTNSQNLTVFSNTTAFYDYLKAENVSMLGDNEVDLYNYNCTYQPLSRDYPAVLVQPSTGNFSIGTSTPSTSTMTGLLRMTAFQVYSDGRTYNRNVSESTFVGNVTGEITTCALDFCAKRYSNVTVHNNVVSVGSTVSLDLVDDATNTATQSRNPRQLWTNFTADGAVNSTGPGVFKVALDDRLSFWEYLLNLFYVTKQTTYRASDYSGNALQNKIGDYLAESDLNKVLSSFADAMTSIVRSSDNTHNVMLAGDAIGAEIYVKVHWAWLACPLAIVVLVTCLLVISIVKNSSRPLLLKSSPLALLFHGMEGWRREELVVAGEQPDVRETPDRLYNIARGMMVRLERNAHGDFKFVKAQ